MRVLLPVHQVSGSHEMIAPAAQAEADLTVGCFTRDACVKGFERNRSAVTVRHQPARRGRRRLG